MDGEDLTVVHKQGFLVKRGGRVRSWRKRLFVLDDAGLSYYKTDQVNYIRKCVIFMDHHCACSTTCEYCVHVLCCKLYC